MCFKKTIPPRKVIYVDMGDTDMDKNGLASKNRDERIVRFHNYVKRWGVGVKSIEKFRYFPASLN